MIDERQPKSCTSKPFSKSKKIYYILPGAAALPSRPGRLEVRWRRGLDGGGGASPPLRPPRQPPPLPGVWTALAGTEFVIALDVAGSRGGGSTRMMLLRNLSSLGVKTPLAPFIPNFPTPALSIVTAAPACHCDNQNAWSCRPLDDLACSWPQESLEL